MSVLFGPQPMAGGGFYNLHSLMQREGISSILHLVDDLSNSIDLKGEIITICDYGCSQGTNSLTPVKCSINRLKQRTSDLTPVRVIHTDLPSNDFSTLFDTVNSDPDSYINTFQHIYPMAVGRSYFEQILPSCSVNLAWNSWTLHWLRDKPNLELFQKMNNPEKSIEQAIANQLDSDWRAFLQARSNELRPLGGLISIFGARSQFKVGLQHISHCLRDIIKNMISSGRITKEEQMRYSKPTAQRSLEQIKAPFVDTGIFAGLKPIVIDVIPVKDVFWDDFINTKDAITYGQRWSNTMRALFEPSLQQAFFDKSNSAEVINEIFNHLSIKLSFCTEPNIHYMGVVVLQKVDTI
jgi:hypothetical protein